jgi:hypothetical protein
MAFLLLWESSAEKKKGRMWGLYPWPAAGEVGSGDVREVDWERVESCDAER